MKTGFFSTFLLLMFASGMARAQGPGSPYMVVNYAAGPPAPVATIGTPTAVPATGMQQVPVPAAGEAPSRAWAETNHAPCSTFWFSVEYLLWWTRGDGLPPLVAALPPPKGFVAPTGEIIHEIGANNIISPDHVSFGPTSGMRFGAGAWLDDHGTVGVDASYFLLEHRSVGMDYPSGGDPILGPAYYAPILKIPAVIDDAAPGARSGGVATALTQQLWGVEANVRVQGVSFWPGRVDWDFGFRHLQLSEGLTMLGTSSTLLPALPSSTTTFDKFGTHNLFYGPQVGISSSHCWGNWLFSWQAKVALGYTHEIAEIQGSTTFLTPAGSNTIPGGVLALPTNIGHHSHNEFSVLPEATAQLGYQATSYLRLFVGYNFLYLDNVLRPGQQIDGSVNTVQIPSLTYFNPATPVNHPVFEPKSESFWAQGITFGAELKF